MFDRDVPVNAWRVRCSESDDLLWEELREGQKVLRRKEPGMGFWQRLGVSIVSLFPIDPLL